MTTLPNQDLTEFLLNVVRPRPGMFLMDRSLKSLQIFLTGYRICLQNSFSSKQDKFVELFSEWFLRTTNNNNNRMWYPLILEECGNSEEKALERFWDYLERFHSENQNVS